MWGVVAIAAGAAVIFLGDLVTGVELEMFKGVLGTFTPLWIVDLIVVPFIAGIVVSVVYGLGGKILAYFSPLLVRIPEYLTAQDVVTAQDIAVLPVGYWILIVIVAVEACAGGGIVGEIVIKRTYGRRKKELLHKRYQVKIDQNS